MLVNVDQLVKTMLVYNTNLLISHPAHNEPVNIALVVVNPGAPFTDMALPPTAQIRLFCGGGWIAARAVPSGKQL